MLRRGPFQPVDYGSRQPLTWLLQAAPTTISLLPEMPHSIGHCQPGDQTPYPNADNGQNPPGPLLVGEGLPFMPFAS